MDLQRELRKRKADFQIIMLHSHAHISTVLSAIKEGAVAFVEKPYLGERLVASVRHAFNVGLEARRIHSEAKTALEKLSLLTPREQGVLEKIATRRSNKVTA